MEDLALILIMAAVFAFGFYVVGMFGRTPDESRRHPVRRVSGKKNGRRADRPEKFFH